MSASASAVPEELWRRILEIGIEFSNFNYKDFCCLSITCTLLNRISSDDSFWSSLFSADFPKYQHPSSSSVSIKSLYKIRYEKVREQKLLAHRRAVLRIQSEINEHSQRIGEMEVRSAEEKEKMKNSVAELLNLRKISQRLSGVSRSRWSSSAMYLLIIVSMPLRWSSSFENNKLKG